MPVWMAGGGAEVAVTVPMWMARSASLVVFAMAATASVGAATAQPATDTTETSAPAVRLGPNVARSVAGLRGPVAVIGVSPSPQWDRAALHDVVDELRRAGVEAIPMSQPLSAAAVGGGEMIVEICTRLGAQGLVAVRGSADGATSAAATVFGADGKAHALLVDGEPAVQQGLLSGKLELAARNRSWGRPNVAGIGRVAMGLGAGALLVSLLIYAADQGDIGSCSFPSLGCDETTRSNSDSRSSSRRRRAGVLAGVGVTAMMIGGIAILTSGPGKPSGASVAAPRPRVWAGLLAAPGAGGATIGGRF